VASQTVKRDLADMISDLRRNTSPNNTQARLKLSHNGQEHPSGEMNIIKGWMKMRNSMKIWINRWFVLRLGKLIYYKDEKDMSRDRCVGILRLADCTVKERPTNKDGFSFKIYHLLHYPIYHKYGLKGETLKMAMIPVSWNYCILRVSSEQDRKTWMTNINQQIEYANLAEASKGQMHRVDSFDMSISPSEDDEKKEDTSPPIEAANSNLEAREAAEDMFVMDKAHEEFQRNLLDGLGVQQKTNIKSIQKTTLRCVEEWKNELDSRIFAVEKKIINTINKNNSAASSNDQISLKYWQLVLLILACIIVAKFI